MFTVLVDPDLDGDAAGEAAELYEQELKPAGFNMAARVPCYPNGIPGGIAVFLVWLS